MSVSSGFGNPGRIAGDAAGALISLAIEIESIAEMLADLSARDRATHAARQLRAEAYAVTADVASIAEAEAWALIGHRLIITLYLGDRGTPARDDPESTKP